MMANMTTATGYSPENSHTTPLGAGASFLGRPQLLNVGQEQVLITCFTDAPGELRIEFSWDAINWDSTFPVPNRWQVAANQHEFQVVMGGGRWFRVGYTNGSTAQTVLRLYTSVGNYGLPNTPLSMSLSADSAAIVVRPAADFLVEAARGGVSGYGYIAKFGYNGAVTAPEDVWQGGGIYTGQPAGEPDTIAETITVTSDDAADAPAGTGMQSALVAGLDNNGDYAEEERGLGTTSTSEWFRVFRAAGSSYGSGGTNAGTVSVAHSTTTANVFCAIAPGIGQSSVAAMTVPAGKRGMLLQRGGGVTNNQANAQEARMALAHRPYLAGGYNLRRPLTLSTVAGQESDTLRGGVIFGSLDDIVERVFETTTTGLAVNADFELIWF